MPIYEYRCPTCGGTFEQRRPISQATDPAACPDCGASSERIVSRLARVSRGGGGEEEFGGSEVPNPGSADLYTSGHGHSHGPMGHGH